MFPLQKGLAQSFQYGSQPARAFCALTGFAAGSFRPQSHGRDRTRERWRSRYAQRCFTIAV
jgi:hypothetical protein